MSENDNKPDIQVVPWTWVAVFVLLSFYTALWTEIYVFYIEFCIFLPILTGWLASRYGTRIFGALLVLGALSTLGIDISLTDSLEIGLNINAWVYVLSVCSAIVFCRPRFPAVPANLFRARFHWLRWFIPLAIWLAVFRGRSMEWSSGESISIYINPGFWLLAVVLAVSLNWAVLRSWVLKLFPAKSSNQKVLLLVFAALVVLSYLFRLRFNAELDFDIFYGFGNIVFGTLDAAYFVSILVFILAASGRLNWRILIAILAVFYLSSFVVDWLIEAWATAFPEPPPEPVSKPDTPSAVVSDYYLEEIIVTGSLIRLSYTAIAFPNMLQGIAATLLGSAIAPFLRQSNPSLLRDHRSSIFLLSALIIVNMGMAVTHYGIDGMSTMLIGGTAYIFGLAWRMRGLIAGTLIIQFMYLTSLFFFAMDPEEFSALDMGRLGFIAFIFAFFGLLSNRYEWWSGNPVSLTRGERQN